MNMNDEDIIRMFNDWCDSSISKEHMEEMEYMNADQKMQYIVRLAFIAGFKKARQLSILR